MVIGLLACSLGQTALAARAAKPEISISGLTVEYRTNPLGIDTAVPRFSWQLQSDLRGQKQTAYRVLVASAPEELARERGDLWDSGRVVSDQSVLVPYTGRKLAAGMDCYWKVRVWDRRARESDWSRPARFSIGPLARADWQGDWIQYPGIKPIKAPERWIWFDQGNPAQEAPAGACWFRRMFTLQTGGKIQSARIRMTADNAFELWINGKRAGSGHDWERIYSMEVTALLQPGDNILAVKAINSLPGPAGLIGRLDIEDQAGKHLTVATDAAWQAAVSVGEHWQTDPAPAKGWRPVQVLGPPEMAPWGQLAGKGPAGRHIWFRKTFILEGEVANAFAYVASIGYHELYVNGLKADDRVLAPAGSRLDRRALYVTYDITDKLRTGKNVLAIWHGPGWARFYRAFHAGPALLVQADIRTRAGKRQSIVSDATWKCRESCSRTVGRGYGGEEIDARKQIPDWKAVGFDDDNWDHAAPVQRKVRISAQWVEPDRIIETIKPVRITAVHPASSNGERKAGLRTFQVDLGRNYTGWLEISNLRGEPGQRITIGVADDPKTRADFGQVHSFICGKNPGTFRNRFNYAGGRYVTIEGLSYQPALADIVGLAISSDFSRTGRFRCSNELLNRIYEMDLWTFRANTVNGVTMDCPHRERLGYGEVTWATAWGCGLPNYRAGAFYTHLVRNWCDVQHENGWIAFVAPQLRSTWGGPLWSSAPLTAAWETYRACGDQRLIQNAYPTCKQWMEFLQARVSNGLLTRFPDERGKFLGDWAAPGGRKEWGGSPEASLFNNCVYALDLKMMIDLAAALDKQDGVALYAGRLEALRKRIHEKFFDPEKNVYLTGRQMHLAFPLYVGAVPTEVKPAVLANLKTEMTATRPYLDMGSSGLPVLLHYLIEDVEWNDVLYTHLNKTTRPSYGYFIAQGETTWPEYWEVNVPSKIHTCYTGIASWFVKGIGGVRNGPGQFGYQAFVIKPHLVGDLKFANTTVESLYGKIVSNWIRKRGAVTLHLEVPPGSTATVYVPGMDLRKVKEAGIPAERSEAIRFLRAERGYLVFHVQSGAYTFVSEM